MNKDSLKDIIFNDDAEKIIATSVGIILFIICLVISHQTLPENCYLYEWRQVGFLCDRFSIENPQPCQDCNNPVGVLIAQIIFGLGIILLLLPLVFLVIKNKRKGLIKQTKLFD